MDLDIGFLSHPCLLGVDPDPLKKMSDTDPVSLTIGAIQRPPGSAPVKEKVLLASHYSVTNCTLLKL